METLARILLVEDDPKDVELTLTALEAYNLANEVVVASDGEQALDFLYCRGKFMRRARENPAVLLLDLKLPKIDGLEVLKQVKSDENLKMIPVVVLTSSREEQDMVASYRLGVNAYVVKPVDFHEFVNAIKELGVFWAVINEPRPEASGGLEPAMDAPLRALHLEDDVADAELVRDTLAADGITCHLTRVETESDFHAALQRGGFDFILADLTLPSFDGLSASRIARQQKPDVPFIFVSGTIGEEAAIEALKIGATDYVLKTRLRRLVPAVRRALREARERADLRRAEAVLRERDAKIRRLVDANIVGVLISDLDGRIIDANDAFLEMVRYTRDDLTSGRLRWTDLTPPEWQVASEEAVSRLRATGTCELFEKEYLRSDGTRVPVLVGAAAIEGAHAENVAFVLDLTERKRVEVLRAGENRILEMVAKGSVLADILDSLCRIVEEQASGVLASILLLDGKRLRHGAAPSLPKAYTDAIDGGFIGPCAGSCGTAAYCGRQVIVADIAGDPLWADYRDLALLHSLRACWSTPVFSSQGHVIATFAMYYREPRTPSPRDQQVIEQITYLAGVAIERQLTHEQLQRSEAYLADAQSLTHTGSFVWDVRTKQALHLSDEWYRIYEFDREKDTCAFEERWHRVFPDDRAPWQAAIDRAITEKSGYDLEARLLFPSGATKHVRVIAHPVLDAAGDVVQFMGSVMDIAERKRAEEQREKLRKLEADLAHINRVSMLGEFAASLSHELKQPITGVITNAGTCLRLLRREPPDVPEADVAAARIVRDANRANEIIDRLRSFYRKDGPAQRELVDVNDIVREMLVLLRAEGSRHSVAMHTELAAALPRVTADRVQLQQVLMNLLLNGIEAMKDSGGELTVSSQRGQDGQLMISVSDTGVGLPAGKTEQIFNAFFTTKAHGSGMGLAIGRSIVESHGGRLWATANIGPGATFHLVLPTATA